MPDLLSECCEGYGQRTTSYQRPGWFTRNIANPVVGGLGKIGISVLGSRVLEVRGRKTGELPELTALVR